MTAVLREPRPELVLPTLANAGAVTVIYSNRAQDSARDIGARQRLRERPSKELDVAI